MAEDAFLDLNYLYLRHQISLFRAENALCVEARRSHDGLARRYLRHIEIERDAAYQAAC